MKTFVKILVLATVVVVALWSIFYFSGTRIAENIDVSDITINDSVYLNDVEGRIANISSSWKSDFLDIDNLISVYYRNNLLSADKEENLKILLVDTAGLQLTTYAIDYFKKSSWNKDCISTLEKDVDLLLRYRSATNKLVVHGDIKNKLKDVKQTCQNYVSACRLGLTYKNNTDAKEKIDNARRLCGDGYLMNEGVIAQKLKGASQTIHDSHWDQIINAIKDLASYSDQYLESECNGYIFAEVRSKVDKIRRLTDDYKSATFYSIKKDVISELANANDYIKDWNEKINDTREEEYMDYSSNTLKERIKTRRVRRYPNEENILLFSEN